VKFILVFFLLFVNLYADDYESHSPKHINKELSHLSLSKNQSYEIKKVLKDFRKRLKEYRELKEEIEEKREKLFMHDNFDEEGLNRLNQILDSQACEIENDLLKKIHRILSKKQRKKFIKYFDDWEVE